MWFLDGETTRKNVIPFLNYNRKNDWRILSLSELTSIIFHIELTHLDLNASKENSFGFVNISEIPIEIIFKNVLIGGLRA